MVFGALQPNKLLIREMMGVCFRSGLKCVFSKYHVFGFFALLSYFVAPVDCRAEVNRMS